MGRELVLKKDIEKYLELNGYETEIDITVEGRSGAKHKIDVLAVKTDAIAKVKIAIDFKRWNKSIGKSAISKFKRVLNDIGADKGIIISLSSKFGFSYSAKIIAEEFNVELWDRIQLARRLETVETLSQLYQLEAKPERLILTMSPKITIDEAANIVVEAKRQTEKAEFTRFSYLPFYLFQFTCSVKKGFIRKKESVKVLWSLCEGIEGKHYPMTDSSVRFTDIHSESFNKEAPIIAPKVNIEKLRKEIEEACSQLDLSHKAVQNLYDVIERTLGGLDAKPRIHSVKELYYPFYVALLKNENGARWFVIDGYSGEHNEEMSDTFNRNFSYMERFLH
jgi:hypothetical protein